MANEEMAQYLGVFLDEANEQIELLERDILELENSPSKELLQEIFRAAHTLKGSSRAMGFTLLGELTHAMEDVFDRLRNDELEVTQPVIDALFKGLDTLKEMIAEVAEEGDTSTDATEVTAQLRAVLGGPAPAAAAAPASAQVGQPAQGIAFAHAPLTPTAREAALDALGSNLSVCRIVVEVAPDCLMKSVRAIMAMQTLDTLGTVLSCTPGEEAIENEEFEQAFGLLFATDKSAEEVQTALLALSEISAVSVTDAVAEFSGQHPASAPAAEASAALPDTAPPAAAMEEKPTEDRRQTVRRAEDREAASEASKKPAAQQQTVRVDVVRLDKLLNLVGELVIDQTRIARVAGQLEHAPGISELMETLSDAAGHLGRITSEMQEEIMKARMLPVDNVFNRFPRMVRDLAQNLGKQVEFTMSGRETELDRSVIEVIADPLIHILRNSVDHGLELPEERVAAGKPEKGNVWLRARHEENHIVIEIEDDGKGIDHNRLRAAAVKKGVLTEDAASRLTEKEAIHLIFASGFSTAKQVSDVSGRGVGMDIVRSNLMKVGAAIEVDTTVGKGSRFTIKLPLTLAIIRGLLVRVADCVYVVPLASVQETFRAEASRVHIVNHREVIVQRGETLPLVRLQNIFYRKNDHTTDDDYVVVAGSGDRRFGLVVDSLLGEQETVIKSMGKFIGDVQGISGATILGDGRIALIADMNGLLTLATEERVGCHAA
jgi:two-component system chemotaxis sensor kinase CheA